MKVKTLRAKAYAISQVGEKVAENKKKLMYQMLYDAGYSIEEIAEEYEVNQEEVNTYVSNITIEESTYKLYQRGWTVESIAGIGRVDIDTVVKRLMKHTTDNTVKICKVKNPATAYV